MLPAYFFEFLVKLSTRPVRPELPPPQLLAGGEINARNPFRVSGLTILTLPRPSAPRQGL
jgi:hypothetical protein